MLKKTVLFVFTLAFVLGSAPTLFAKSADCMIKSVNGTEVTLDCGADAKNIKAGSTVKVKTAKKKKAIEGC